MTPSITRSRVTLLALIFVFALPALIAKLVLSQHWYNSGVTNKGQLIDPSANFEALGIKNPYFGEQWQLGYVVPAKCDAICQQHLHLLKQSHIALGKYQQRVAPVVFVREDSDLAAIEGLSFDVISVNEAFSQVVDRSEYVIVDPLGQLVMRYPNVQSEDKLVAQSKDVLGDLRKLLKLSRVG
ncbi:hypothetical protein [Vibrio renipiscarius]|uniref:Cytochrome oxidase biogenesis cluster protein n=1 Tax=Vibrio renipiscarius TaxID=1461322 RepID=A0A0C2JK47_9VIBR|nr:hypothetical protein [Vibrio renipiscarius]KII76155.1 hypothetical protein OJ16_15175 [Vibrio renipiscarius]KII78324.1 hypothetical protein PL18_15395 [Vibrio renipiscarius]